MRIDSITFQNFMRHRATTLDLPPTGVVVIMGPNGAGKSSFLEGVCYAFHGKTLRGTPPWQRERAGTLRVESDLVSVLRRVTVKGTRKLKWRAPGEEEWRKYDTASKGECELAATVGDLDIWRRTHVFSSSDAANFSTATDGERKVLVEQILGVDRFNTGVVKCRTDLRAAEEEHRLVLSKVVAVDAALDKARALLEQLDEPVLDVSDPPAPIPRPREEPDLPALCKALAELRTQIENLQFETPETPGELFTDAVPLSRVAASRAQTLVRLAEAGVCGACEQAYVSDVSVAETARDAAVAVHDNAVDALAAERERCKEVMTKRQELLARLNAVWYSNNEDIGSIEDVVRAADRRDAEIAHHNEFVVSVRQGHAEVLARYQARKDELDDQIFDGVDELFRAKCARALALLEVHELKECEKVLGLKGARVPVLGKALGAAEVFANSWLQMLNPEIQVRIRPYTVLADGVTTNSNISLEVDGVGEGYGYHATSGGERRRLDAAILLAFAEVHAASSGRPGGTLWVDEIFDALDDDGCAAAASMLADIGSRRCVVVITHKEDLARQINAVARYRVRAGELCQEGIESAREATT